MNCAEYLDLVAAHVDGQLEPAELVEVEAHLTTCTRCQAAHDAQRVTKQLLRRGSLHAAAPEAVRARIARALDAEAVAPTSPPRSALRRTLLVGAMAAGLALVLIPLRLLQPPDLLGTLVQDVRAANAQEIPLDVTTGDVDVLKQYYRNADMPFEHTVADLSGLGFHPVGGTSGEIDDVRATFTVYRTDSGNVLCRRFAVGAIEMPPGGEPFGTGMLYTVDGVTIWIHPDHDAMCCLVTAMPREEFLEHLRGKKGHTHS